MVSHRASVSFSLLLFALLLPGTALACPDEALSRLLQRADEARSWSDFWEDLDPGESRTEMLRARWLFGRAERLLLQDGCMDTSSGFGFAGRIADGQRWSRRAAARAPGSAAVAAFTR